MADSKVVIELKVTGGENKKEDKKNTGTNLDKDGFYDLSAETEASGDGDSGIASYILSNAVSIIKGVAEYEIDKRFNLRDDYIGQNQYTAFKAQVAKAKEFISAAKTGASIGGLGGTAGAAAGAMIGVAIAVAKTLIEMHQIAEQQQIALNTNLINSGFKMERLGLVDNSEGTLN